MALQWQYCLVSGGIIIEFFESSGGIRVYDLLREETDKKGKTSYRLVASDDKEKFYPFEFCIGILGSEGWEIVQVGNGPSYNGIQERHYGIWSTIQECQQVHWAFFKRPHSMENPPRPPSLGANYLWVERDDKSKPHYR